MFSLGRPPHILNQCCSEPQLLMCVSHPSGMLKWEGKKKKSANHCSINLIQEGHEPHLWTEWAFTFLCKVPVRRDLNKYSLEEGPLSGVSFDISEIFLWEAMFASIFTGHLVLLLTLITCVVTLNSRLLHNFFPPQSYASLFIFYSIWVHACNLEGNYKKCGGE